MLVLRSDLTDVFVLRLNLTRVLILRSNLTGVLVFWLELTDFPSKTQFFKMDNVNCI